nr:TOBE domain-containing protein [Labrys wisconsinensis]
MPCGEARLPAQCFTAGLPAPGEPVTLCVRPEHFRRGDVPDEALALGPATVTGAAFFGTHYRCHARLASASGLELVMHLEPTAPVAQGQPISLAVKAADVVALRGDAAASRTPR